VSASLAAATPAPTSDCVRGVTNLEKAIHNLESAKKATDSCGDCFSTPHGTSLGPSGRTKIFDAGADSLIARGGRGARCRAVVAVVRKLAILPHHLWVTGEDYDSFRNSRTKQQFAELASA